jgi:hypothetical protein
VWRRSVAILQVLQYLGERGESETIISSRLRTLLKKEAVLVTAEMIKINAFFFALFRTVCRHQRYNSLKCLRGTPRMSRSLW